MDTETIDQVNQIKRKLTKYTEKKPDVNKVNEYLELLGSFQVNNNILKETEIYKYLKELKKKENPAFSKNAANLMSKWKTQALNNSNELNCKYEPKSINTNTNNQASFKDAYNPTTKNNSKSKVIENNSKKSSQNNELSQKSRDNKGKKRISEANSLSENKLEKKAKLSLSDYKIKKPQENINEFDSLFETGSNKTSECDETSNQYDKYGLDFEVSDDETNENYSPTPIIKQEKLENIKTNEHKFNKNHFNNEGDRNSKYSDHSKSKSKTMKKHQSNELSSVKLEKNDSKNIIVPPKPSVPIEDLFSNKQESISYEPTPKATSSSLRLPVSTRPGHMHLKSTDQPTETVEEALEKIMRMKKTKRVLYTGKKSAVVNQPTVPKLYNLCAKSLINNLDSLPLKISTYNMTHDFAIAFELLRPVLEQANAKQLENIENYSPHLLNDTDYIWKKLSEMEFKKVEEPDEDESWRELYFKKLDDREKMFQRARNKAKEMQRNKAPERVTKMATMRPAKNMPYLGPKSYNGPRSGQSIEKTTTSAARYTKSAPKVVIHHERKPATGFSRNPPVMSQGMRATMKMLKSRRK